MQKITKQTCENLNSIGYRNCEITMDEKVVCFQMLEIKFHLEIKFVENYFFLEKYNNSEGAVSHNVLYYQQLHITRYQVR